MIYVYVYIFFLNMPNNMGIKECTLYCTYLIYIYIDRYFFFKRGHKNV